MAVKAQNVNNRLPHRRVPIVCILPRVVRGWVKSLAHDQNLGYFLFLSGSIDPGRWYLSLVHAYLDYETCILYLLVTRRMTGIEESFGCF